VKDPGRDLPIGIVGSLGICTVFYMLMCLVITGMQPYDQIDLHAPFSVAFTTVRYLSRLLLLLFVAGVRCLLLNCCVLAACSAFSVRMVFVQDDARHRSMAITLDVSVCVS
jgi:amino acid transporter